MLHVDPVNCSEFPKILAASFFFEVKHSKYRAKHRKETFQKHWEFDAP